MSNDLEERPQLKKKRGGITGRTRLTTKLKLELADRLIGTGTSPLEFLLRNMNNPDLPNDLRQQAAISAAPYVHSKMPTVNLNSNLEMTHEEWLAELEEDQPKD